VSWRDDEHEADDLDQKHDPDESDMDDSEEPVLVPCPHCGKYVLEQAERCHRCGRSLEARRTLPMWVVVTAALLLLACVLSILYFGTLRL
jgi:uncharacterized paraquat-inducible protein A